MDVVSGSGRAFRLLRVVGFVQLPSVLFRFVDWFTVPKTIFCDYFKRSFVEELKLYSKVGKNSRSFIRIRNFPHIFLIFLSNTYMSNNFSCFLLEFFAIFIHEFPSSFISGCCISVNILKFCLNFPQFLEFFFKVPHFLEFFLKFPQFLEYFLKFPQFLEFFLKFPQYFPKFFLFLT